MSEWLLLRKQRRDAQATLAQTKGQLPQQKVIWAQMAVLDRRLTALNDEAFEATGLDGDEREPGGEYVILAASSWDGPMRDFGDADPKGHGWEDPP